MVKYFLALITLQATIKIFRDVCNLVREYKWENFDILLETYIVLPSEIRINLRE